MKDPDGSGTPTEGGASDTHDESNTTVHENNDEDEEMKGDGTGKDAAVQPAEEKQDVSGNEDTEMTEKTESLNFLPFTYTNKRIGLPPKLIPINHK